MEQTVGLTVYVRQMSFTHPLPRDRAVQVGRGIESTIRIDETSVSREHAEVLFDGEKIWIEDLGSSNGTELHRPAQGQGPDTLQPHRRYPLCPGDVVRFGGVPAVVQIERSRSVANRSTTPPTALGNGRILIDREMKRVYELASRAACSDISVLITGETGVGKELLAAAVHENSRRSSKPFLQLNCAALAETLLESELFGHEKGAFTGASTSRPGLLESAQGGTIFLDELGEMPLSTQTKLLRVLEERRIRRLGSTRSIDIDVRFVAATNREMNVEVALGRFREDLFYRISGINLKVPPLRERKSEIEPLARHLLTSFCMKSGIDVPEISPAGMEQLREYLWPGNVRELKNAMERAPFLSGGAPLLPEHLPQPGTSCSWEDTFPDERTDVRSVPWDGPLASGGDADRIQELVVYADEAGRLSGRPSSPWGIVHERPVRSGRPARSPTPTRSVPAVVALRETRTARLRPGSALDVDDRVPSRPIHGNSKSFSEEEERRRVVGALEACSGNQTRAAEMLGISRRTLINRIEAFGIPRPRKPSRS